MNWLSSIISLVTSFFRKKLNAGSNTSTGDASVSLPGDSGPPAAKPSSPAGPFDESRILQDYSVTQKWHSGWKRPLDQVTEVVIHHTAGTGNIETLKKWMLGGERKSQYIKGISLFHFAVDKDGKIWKAGPISRWWYHSCSRKHDQYTVGIENVHKSGPFTKAQYDSLFWLLFDYMPHFCPSYNRIVSHDYNYNTYSNMKKGCPGPDFDWKKLEAEMKKRKIQFDTHGFEEYTLTFPA